MNTSEEVAKILLEVNAISLSPKKPYRYASGILSPIYTDCRLLLGYPKLRKKVAALYVQAIENSGAKFDLVAGTATAGIAHAAWIADKMNLPMVYVRSKSKEHGKENLMEGVITNGQKACVIEDLVSTGDSSINSAKAVRASGGKASHVFAIITYGMKVGAKNLKENKLKLVSLTTFADVVSQAQKMGSINREEKELILDWVKDPTTWGKRHGFE